MTKQLKAILKHSSIYSIGTIVGQLVGFLLLPLYTRYLTPSDYGVAAILEVTLGLISVVVGWGILDGMNRYYQEYNDSNDKNLVISTVYWILLIFSLLSWFSIYSSSSFLSNLLFSDVKYSELFKIAATVLAVGYFADAGMRYLMIKQKSTLYVFISIVNLLTMICLNIFFIVYLELGLIGIYYSSLIARCMVAFFITIPVVIDVGVRFSSSFAVLLIRFSFPLILSGVMTIATKESDKYFINYFLSPVETGIYAIANKVGFAIHVLITIPFMQGYSPSRFELAKQKDAQDLYAKILNYYVMLMVTCGLVLSVFSVEIIRIMTTNEYISAGHLIPLVVLSWLFAGIRCHLESGILVALHTKYFAYISAGTGLLILVLNYWLIGTYGVLGALIVLNVSQVVAAAATYLIAQKLYPINYQFNFIIKVVAIGIFCYVSSMLLEQDSIIVSIVFKTIVLVGYFLILWISGLIDELLVKTVKEFLTKRLGWSRRHGSSKG